MTQIIDKVLVSILRRRLKAITDEISITLEKTTCSPILCEAKDFVTGLYDAKGRMLEQTENLPILAFSLAPVCKYIIDYFGNEVYPGDVFFHNDVFSMGNQNNDVAAFKPIFFQDVLVGWSACKGHQADIGTIPPWLYQAEKVFQDVRNGVLSPDQARALYGVVINVETMTLDLQEIEKFRGQI